VLKGAWTDETVEAAFREVLAARQQKLGLAYQRSRPV
jgi:hypothetical protein